ncbi:hypothetical protein EKO27_g2937 [Xylaria grammica]|uniref:Protamine P1 n=1 Tax=Xylaria grammica TaxID=363999 RepID=A0A439DCN4_9PEZI|nr:hypothetical protein EKO27_g2937 [Xylaria grammica]
MMNGHPRETDAWQQTCLGNESLYCPEPSPLGPDDIIYRGSDDEIDDATKIAKILRYEKHGRRFLQGEALYLLSASLRGPFNKASGWQNPWLPKLPSQQAQYLRNASPPPPGASSAARHERDMPVGRIPNVEDDTIQGADDSMECHLPSPQSHEDLQFSHSPLRFERLSRIESWAENAHEGILEKDNFWAPGHGSIDHNVGSTGKRPVGRDWLKRRPAKRQRPNASQSTEATSTPTPLSTAQPRAKGSRNSAIGKKSASRSFEMTTPSSSPGQGSGESPGSAEHQPLDSYEEDTQPVTSTVPLRDGRGPIEPHAISKQEESQREDGGVEGGQEVEQKPDETKASKIMYQGQHQRQTPHSEKEPEEIRGFQNYADESFCYRARQFKQAMPLATSNAKAPTSPKHNYAVALSSSMDNREHNSDTISNHSIASDVEHVETLDEHSGSAVVYDGPDQHTVSVLGPDHRLVQFHETMSRGYDITDTSVDTTCALGVNTRGPLSDITSNECTSRLNICNRLPQTVLEAKEAASTSPNPFFDEGETLIGDSVGMEKPRDAELIQENLGHYSSEVSFLLQQYAISATTMANASQQSQCGEATSSNNTHDPTSSILTTTSQQEAVELQPTADKPIMQSSPEEVANLVPGTEVTVGQDEDIRQVMSGGQPIPPEQQSPWPSLCTGNESAQPTKDSIKPVDNELGEIATRPIKMLLDSPVPMYSSPAIRPSQQSPWTRVAESMNTVGLEGAVSTESAVAMSIEVSEIFQSPPLPEVQEHTWLASSLAAPPVSSNRSQVSSAHQSPKTNIASKEDSMAAIEKFPHTPVPRVPRQSTPDGGVSIRSFSNFNFSSPQGPLFPPSSSVRRSILSHKNHSSTRTSTRSTRRVLFAPLPHEQDDNSSQFPTKLRAVSPPPPALVNLEEENVDGKYRNHFNVMNNRINVHGTTALRYHQRLLASSSQQKPESPLVGAMAEAFREADAQQLDHTGNNVIQGIEVDEGESVEETEDKPQSPWQHDSQGTDDVAAVMGNLNQFLDVWDVETEIDRNRVKLDETRRW